MSLISFHTLESMIYPKKASLEMGIYFGLQVCVCFSVEYILSFFFFYNKEIHS